MININLRWVDPLPDKPTFTSIYRAEGNAPLAEWEGILIATVPTSDERYQDQGLDESTTYTYRLKTTLDNHKEAWSKIFSFSGENDTGPGLGRTVFGDAHFGYCTHNEISSTIIPTLDDLRSAIGITVPAPVTPPNINLHKYRIRGISKYILEYPIAYNNEVDKENENYKTLLDGGWIAVNKGGHRWIVQFPQALDMKDGTFIPLANMIDVISEMYGRVIDTVYGNVTGQKINPNKTGKFSFYSNVAHFTQGELSGTILTSIPSIGPGQQYSDRTLLHWTKNIPDSPTDPANLIMPVTYRSEEPELETAVNHALIWPILTYGGLDTQ
ncbi:hypothetical protein RVBP21_2420 [Pseudomonas phage BRkr]|nr:hypothetical protein RVBP21_2420 [Pseudomonas phage BRkr]